MQGTTHTPAWGTKKESEKQMHSAQPDQQPPTTRGKIDTDETEQIDPSKPPPLVRGATMVMPRHTPTPQPTIKPASPFAPPPPKPAPTPEQKQAIKEILFACFDKPDERLAFLRKIDPELFELMEEAIKKAKLATTAELSAMETRLRKEQDEKLAAMETRLKNQFDQKLSAVTPTGTEPAKNKVKPTEDQKASGNVLTDHMKKVVLVLKAAAKDPGMLSEMQDALGIQALSQTRPSALTEDVIQHLNEQGQQQDMMFNILLRLAMEMDSKQAMEMCLKMVETKLALYTHTHDRLKQDLSEAQAELNKVNEGRVEDTKAAYVSRVFTAENILDPIEADQRWDELNDGYAAVRSEYLIQLKATESAHQSHAQRLEAYQTNTGILELYRLQEELRGNLLPHTSVTEAKN